MRSDSVVLRTDKTQYKAGEQLTLTFENKSASSYAFNPCTRSLEREAGGSWTAVPDEGRMCTMEAWILDARGTRTGTTELPSALAPGRYRVVVRMTVESPGSGGGGVTQAHRTRRAAGTRADCGADRVPRGVLVSTPEPVSATPGTRAPAGGH